MNKAHVSLSIALALLAFQNCAPSPETSQKASSTTNGGTTIGGTYVGAPVSPFGNSANPTFDVPVDFGTVTEAPPVPAGTLISSSGTTSFNGSSWTLFKSGVNGDSIAGTAGRDAIQGNDGDDIIGGATGDDYIHANRGNDTVNGGAGNDVIYGGRGDDTLYGDRGDDILFGDLGKNTLHGANPNFAGTSEDGNDTFVVFIAEDNAAEYATNTIFDKGGSNRLLCRNTAFTAPVGGTAWYEGNDLVIFFTGRGSVKIVDYKLAPFAAIDCGPISLIQ
ncbi:MAG: hypothetical protein V4760_04565 [Bdellovibrionota bacterium]